VPLDRAGDAFREVVEDGLQRLEIDLVRAHARQRPLREQGRDRLPGCRGGDGGGLRDGLRNGHRDGHRDGTDRLGEIERGVLVEDGVLEALQTWARLDPELRDQPFPRRAVRLERLRLPAGAVQRDHQLAAQALSVGVLSGQRLQFADDGGMSAQSERRLDPLLDGEEAQLLQPPTLGAREVLEEEVGEGRSAPEREGVLHDGQGLLGLVGGERIDPLVEEPLEADAVDAFGIDPEDVARGAGHEDLGLTPCSLRFEQLPQLGDVHVEDVGGRFGRLARPEVVDQPVGRHDLAGVQEQRGEQRALLGAPETERLPSTTDFERPENQEVQVPPHRGRTLPHGRRCL
jgi:hypothetical protein